MLSRSTAQATRNPPPPPSLLMGLRAGERAAQAELFDRYVDMVERILLRVLGPDTELEDLVQETFLQAITSVESFRGDEGSLGAWLRSVAVRTALKRLRWRSVRRRFGLRMQQDGELDLPETLEPEVYSGLVRLNEALDDLVPAERVAFVLRFFEGMELSEVAAACDVSLATIKRRLRRGRDRMHDIARRDPILSTWLPEGGR